MINKVSRNDMRKTRHERIRESLAGTATRPRLNVFRSNANITAQIIDDEKGVTLVSASSLEKELKLKNGGNVGTVEKDGKPLLRQDVFAETDVRAALEKKFGKFFKIWKKSPY